MCGIAGIVGLGQRPVDPGRIKPMCDVLAHRGPDDAGYAFFRVGEGRSGEGGYWCGFADAKFRYINEHLPVFDGAFCRDELSKSSFSVALGHRRLAIIDLTHFGHQPMSSSDRRFWITYNGEIYNFPELREQLRAAGHVFRTRSDTEVILHLWEEHGTECLPMLDGMFAFAVYDRVANVLTLVRDRFGVKPLYYVPPRRFPALCQRDQGDPGQRAAAAADQPAGAGRVFRLSEHFQPADAFQGRLALAAGRVSATEAGHGRRAGAAPLPWRFSGARSVARRPATGRRAGGRGFFPRGGPATGQRRPGRLVPLRRHGQRLDRRRGRPLDPRLLTFTAGFDLTNVNGVEQGFDERKLAEKLAYLLQTEHYDVVLHAGDMPAAMEKIAWHMDDPRVGMCHQNWYVGKLASRFVKVCLAGAGGDELFGGYPWRYRHGLTAGQVEEFDQKYFDYWHRLLPAADLPQLFVPELWRHNARAARELRPGAGRRAPLPPGNEPADNLFSGPCSSR